MATQSAYNRKINKTKMKTFDPTRRHEESADRNSFNREDSTGRGDDAYKAFTKDKRVRTASKPNRENSSEHREFSGNRAYGEHRRRSFNPNFTKDNRPVNESASDRSYGHTTDSGSGDTERSYSRPRDKFEERRNFSERHFSPRNDFSRRTSFRRDRNDYGENRYRRNDFSDRPHYNTEAEGDNEGNIQTSTDNFGHRDSFPRRNDNRRYNSYKPRFGNNSRYNDNKEESSETYMRPAYRDDATPREEGAPRREYGNRPRFNKRDRDMGERHGYMPRERREYGQRDNYKTHDRYVKQETQPEYTAENYPKFPAPVIENEIRLNRYISMSGICSRREADEYITAGRITVNDTPVTELGTKVSQNDVVKLDGNVIENEKKVYILMNKPKGYVTSIDDPHADKTVMDLLKNACKERIYPIGRLDKNSVGVLLFTNDGDLAKKLTHPSFEKKKVYQVTLNKPLTKADMEQIAEGITLEDGEIHADEISYVSDKKNEVGIEIHSGRNRIVRRIFDHLGYKVTKLDRVYFAGLTKLKLKRGMWRFLTPKEVAMLKSGSFE